MQLLFSKNHIIFLLFIMVAVACKDKAKPESELLDQTAVEQKLAKEIGSAADKHFETWFPRVVDTINGGYFTNFEYNWDLSVDQPKMLVTQARDLWTSSLAAQYYPENKAYKMAADHGYAFITSKMWDSEYGGFYQNYPDVTGAGNVVYKLLYGNAFALYALSEYAKINTSNEALSWVKKTFLWLDQKARRPGEQGYYNVLTNEVMDQNSDAYKAFARGVGWGDPNWKDQNTSIHILEALTNTFRVWPDDRVKLKLEELLTVVRDKMVNDQHYLNLNFDKNFKAISNKNKTRQEILDNINNDHISFGHNIETAFLLVDAAKTLYGEIDSTTMNTALSLLDHTIKYGFGPQYSGIYDKAYQFEGADTLEIVNKQKTWWAQAEALHTLILFADLQPIKKNEYLGIADKLWTYMESNIIDSDHGGWYGSGLDITPEDKTKRKAHQWKGPYHDGRALLFCKNYLNKK